MTTGEAGGAKTELPDVTEGVRSRGRTTTGGGRRRSATPKAWRMGEGRPDEYGVDMTSRDSRSFFFSFFHFDWGHFLGSFV